MKTLILTDFYDFLIIFSGCFEWTCPIFPMKMIIFFSCYAYRPINLEIICSYFIFDLILVFTASSPVCLLSFSPA